MTIRKPTHPGTAFKALVMDDLHLTVAAVSNILGVNEAYLEEVISGKIALSFGMAELWASLTQTSASSWYDMQLKVDKWEENNSNTLWRG